MTSEQFRNAIGGSAPPDREPREYRPKMRPLHFVIILWALAASLRLGALAPLAWLVVMMSYDIYQMRSLVIQMWEGDDDDA